MHIWGWFPSGLTGLISLQSKGRPRDFSCTMKASILQCSTFFMVQLSHPHMTTGITIALTIQTFVGKVASLIFNTVSWFVVAFLPRSKHLLIAQCIGKPRNNGDWLYSFSDRICIFRDASSGWGWEVGKLQGSFRPHHVYDGSGMVNCPSWGMKQLSGRGGVPWGLGGQSQLQAKGAGEWAGLLYLGKR